MDITPGTVLVCRDAKDWEQFEVGDICTVTTVSKSAFGVSTKRHGNITVLAKFSDDFLKLEYVEISSSWASGPGDSAFLCCAVGLNDEVDWDYLRIELGPDLLGIQWALDEQHYRGIKAEPISRERYCRGAPDMAVDHHEWDYSITLRDKRVSMHQDVLNALMLPKFSERYVVASLMVSSARRMAT